MLKVAEVVGKVMFVDLFRILLNGFVRILKSGNLTKTDCKNKDSGPAHSQVFFFYFGDHCRVTIPLH